MMILRMQIIIFYLYTHYIEEEIYASLCCVDIKNSCREKFQHISNMKSFLHSSPPPGSMCMCVCVCAEGLPSHAPALVSVPYAKLKFFFLSQVFLPQCFSVREL
jgi:hypothetical protein